MNFYIVGLLLIIHHIYKFIKQNVVYKTKIIYFILNHVYVYEVLWFLTMFHLEGVLIWN